MRKEKESVAKLVREIISLKPIVLGCIELGIVNYSSLASIIKNEIENNYSYKVSYSAVKSALIRYAKKLRFEGKPIEKNVYIVLKDTNLELITDLIMMTISKEAIISRLDEIMKLVSNARFFQLTQGVKTFTFILPRELYKGIIDIIGIWNVIEMLNNQAAIVMINPPRIMTTPGIVAYITTLLAFNGINITQIISCYIDTVLVLNEEDSYKAFYILRELITKFRKH